jgi:DNA-binding LacI/PurR family transcriptional regulator
MSSRQQTREGREELRESLLQSLRSGALRPGDALPPVRELAKQHGLSPATAQRVLSVLADEGVLQLRQGAGAFVGRLPEHGERAFAAVFGSDLSQLKLADQRAARDGFEAEIARRGATVITLTPRTRGLHAVLHRVATGVLPIGGVFFFGSMQRHIHEANLKIAASLGGARVEYSDDWPEPTTPQADTIRFDDRDGARQAVAHLWRRGHRRIAFLAVHGQSTPAGEFAWSRRREAGFREALSELRTEPHVFLPARAPQYNGPEVNSVQKECGRQAARSLVPSLRDGTVKAVICANKFALSGLLEELREAALPEANWPAIVAFDDDARDDHLLSVLRLPWDELGREAAAALWDRNFGSEAQRNARPREILVPMRLVARLSCFDHDHAMNGTVAAALAA